MTKYIYVQMPLNSNGDGPEMNKELVVKVSHEIWDAETFLTEAVADNECAARLLCDYMNRRELE